MLEPTFRSRDPEHTIDLKDVIALDADAAGNVYALQRQGDDEIGVVVLDGRMEVLEAQQRQGSIQGPARITSPAVAYAVRIQPTVDFDVRGMQVAPSGLYLLLHGLSCQDSSVIAMAVVDLHGGQPTAAGARCGHGTRVKSCRLHQVDPVLFGSRPGLVLYQVAWHPHSEEHFVVLTSDNRLRLYHVTHTLAVAEQTLHIVLATKALPQRYGLGLTAASPGTLGAATGGTTGDAPTSDIVAFAFGPAVGWGLFSFLLLATDGSVYSLGPVAPFGMRCPSSLLERLVGEKAAALEWLRIVFGADAVGNPAAKNRWPVLPHVVEGASPAVVGPLNQRTSHETPLMTQAMSINVAHILTSATADSGALSSLSTVIVGSVQGLLFAYAIVGPWEPAWCESAPQYMSVTGTASATPSAVRYKCTMRPAGKGTGPGTIAATPFMVLLDIVEVPCTLPRHGTDDKLGAIALEDEEDEDVFMDGYGASVSAVAAARRSMSIQIQAGVTGSAVVVVGAGTAARAAVTVWVCQTSSACWRITLPWSGILAQWLTDAAGPPQVRGNDALPAQLPAPVVTCVYDATTASKGSPTQVLPDAAADSTAAVGSCLLQNPMLGGGLLVLSLAGVLHYFQPAGAASLIMEQEQQMATASPRSPQQQASMLGNTSSLTPGASPEQRKAQVEAHIGLMYGNLMVPPPDRNLPAPCSGSPKPLPVASSEGLVYLIDCITALRGKHMAFLHGAAVDLQSRADALHAEAGKHAAAVVDLVAMAAALEARQEILETRLSRIKLLHGNLVERAGMLASLHWTMPRAMSLAEIAATEELSGMEMRVKSLQRQWDISSVRARCLCEERHSRCGLASVRVTSIPEAQLEKVQDAVMGQSSGLAAVRSGLTNLERLAAAAAADRAAERLQKGLSGVGRADKQSDMSQLV
ncbi:hypothetical protein Vretifemale_16191 [Volvox reticuliferus]|uniref:Nucleoporin Nup88 n=1 Tax=Volvox reticuliferus TaxID=1737510 RepID=A0A8J4CR33_9CHLO|nr:hypothetical protein Vretifemale_16191 [Volvox reticuliferus]GIL88248.1 hypothetical protein Vretifemale_16191 [Volvox reticuliferus]